MIRRPAALAVMSLLASALVARAAYADEPDAGAPDGGAPDATAADTAPSSAETASSGEAAHPDAAAAPPERNLAMLVRLAVRRYPGLSAASHHIRSAEALMDESRVAPYLDGISATGVFAVAPTARGNPAFSPDAQLPLSNPWGPSVTARIDGVIPLWTFGKLDAVRDLAAANLHGAQADRDRQVQQLKVDVRRAYFGLGLSLDALEMVSEGKSKLEQAIERLQQRIDADDPDADPVERWRLVAALAEVEGRESEAIRLRESSTLALETLTGETSFTVPDCPLTPVDVPLHPTSWYQEMARVHRGELLLVREAVNARNAQVDLATANYFPDLALAFTAGVTYTPGITDQQNPFVFDPANTPMLGGALVARWNLDFAGIRYREMRAREDRFEMLDRQTEAQRGVSLEVAATVEQLRDAKRREEAWGRGHRESRQWFVSAAQSYSVGTNEARDLVDAMRAYFTARFNHMQAILDVNVSYAQLERVVGVELVREDGWEAACR